MSIMTQPRRALRSGLSVPDRLNFLDDDVDELHEDIAGVNARLDKIFITAVGILVSTTTASITLVLTALT